MRVWWVLHPTVLEFPLCFLHSLVCIASQGGQLGKRECPFLEASWEMLHHNPSILYFKRASIGLQV